MKIGNQSFSKLVTCTTLLLALGSCSGGGSGGGETTTPPAPPAGSVTVTGTVLGTVIKVLRAGTNAVISQADTAPLVNPPFPFSLSSIPVGTPIKVFFFSAGQTFPLYIGNTNVFTVLTTGPIDLGFVTMNGGIATPTNQPSNVTLGVEDLSPLPSGIEPPPATLTVTAPAQATGSVIVDFVVQSFVIGEQGQQHLHISVDSGPTRHFFNGQSKKVVDDNGQLTNDVQWQNSNSFVLNGLSVNQHQVSVKLATASDSEFTNREANPFAVIITINSPSVPPATLTITSPLQGASLPSGPVNVSFSTQNFSIGDPGTPHLHIYLDGGAANHFFNGTTNQVLNGNGQPVTSITRQDNTSFQITGLSNGPHTIRLALASAADLDLQNAEANPPLLNISIQAPPSTPTLTIMSPAQGAILPVGPVLVTFNIQNSPVGPSTTQPQMHFYVDNDPVAYKFYNGPGIGEEGSLSGVRYQGIHTHFVHWKSLSSIEINGLSSTTHLVRFVLTGTNDSELPNPEATKTLNFSINTPPSGDLQLQPILTGLNVPAQMATAPDGRIFVNELNSGNIRVVTPTTTPPWQLQATPFATLPVVTGGEKGLLGIAVDPSFSENKYVYVFYTAAGPVNRVGRFTAMTTSGGNTVATIATPEIIFDNIPAGDYHNGGIIQFGSDGMLYIFVGDNTAGFNAQILDSLRGKILRISPNGGIPSDNPFFNTLQTPFSAIFSYGHRNSFGLTFHGHTGDLWETENGPDDNDEINRIVAGGNYGWPEVRGIAGNPNFRDPILAYTPTIAPTGIIAIPENSSTYPVAYRNNLLFVDYKEGKIRRVVLSGADLTQLGTSSIAYNGGNGGLLSLMLGADGFVYVSNSDAIFKVVPQ